MFFMNFICKKKLLAFSFLLSFILILSTVHGMCSQEETSHDLKHEFSNEEIENKDNEEKSQEHETKEPVKKKKIIQSRKTIKNKTSNKRSVIHKARGVTFVQALIAPMNYELNDRFWGWRPNDILNFTDNINNLQEGILEVTRRTVIVLAERISRTGSNDSFDENVENAMNWFMVKADSYWFPSPESKYNEGIEELERYIKRLSRGTAKFYSRTDNLYPLLKAYDDLLGSCDQNLFKTEEDGEPISWSKVDDILYYTKGVATAMHMILEGVEEEFHETLDGIQGSEELLHHIIHSCYDAKNINPWLVTDGNLSSVFANHRANMAHPLNHARRYIEVLIKTLSGY